MTESRRGNRSEPLHEGETSNFGMYLRDVRIRLNLSQAQMASMAGFEASSIARMEGGSRFPEGKAFFDGLKSIEGVSTSDMSILFRALLNDKFGITDEDLALMLNADRGEKSAENSKPSFERVSKGGIHVYFKVNI